MATEDLKIRISGDLTSIKAALKGLGVEFEKLGKSGKAAGDKTETSMQRIEASVRNATRALGGFAAAYTAISAVRTITGISDQFAQLNGVLKLATTTTEEFAKAQKGVYDIAQLTRAPVKETADTYAALERTTRTLGLSQNELLRTLETVNKSIALTPVSAQAAQASLVQFGQALGGDFKAGAQELNSILEQTPGLAISIAQGLGVETSALKKMGEQGELSAELVIRGLLRISEEVDEKFAKVPLTVSGAMQQLKNDLVFTLGQADMSPLIEALGELRAVVTDPAVAQGLIALASGISKVAAASIEGVAGVANFTKWVGEELAVAVGGPAGDDLVRLSDRIGELNDKIKELASLRGKGFELGQGTEANRERRIKFFEQERDALQAQYDAARQAAEQEAILAAKKKATGEQEKQAAAAKAEADFKAAQAAREKKKAEEEASKEAEKRQKQIRDAIADLEQEAATYGKSTEEVVKYRMALLGANEAQTARAVAAAKRVDQLKVDEKSRKDAEKAAEERKKAEEQLAKDLADIRIRSLELAGRGVEARQAELAKQFDPIIAQLKEKGDEAGIALVNGLINSELAAARLEDIRKRAGEVVQQMQQAEQTSAARVAGGGDPAVADEEQRAARETAIAQLRELRAELVALPTDTQGAQEALAGLDQVIGETALQNLNGVNQAIFELRTQLAQMQQDFAGDAIMTLRDSLTGLFTDIASGSKSAGDALKDFVRGFAQQMAALAARALATYILLQTLDAIYPGLGRATAAAIGVGANVKHGGGIVGSGTFRRVDPLVFAAAPRYHAGGIAGLKPGEVPAVLQKGEEVLTKDDQRHAANGGAGKGTRVVNVFDKNFVPDQLDSAEGEKVIMNIIGRNPGRVKQLLG